MDRLEGKTIKAVRLMTKKEMRAEGWDRPTIVLVLDDGTKIYPSCDEEGNGSGELFCEEANGDHTMIWVYQDKN